MAVINTNVASLVSQRNLFRSGASLQTSIERLSSGLRINSARDDAAGLAISERMTGQLRGMEVAKRNAGDGISAMQVADGALASITDNLQRMRELAIQSQNGTLNAGDRDNLNFEYLELRTEVQRVAQTTAFNGVALFRGADGANGATGELALELQIGANNDEEIQVSLKDIEQIFLANNDATALTTFNASLISGAGGTGISNSEEAVLEIDAVLNSITQQRAVMGAGINRLEAVINNLDTSIVNLSTARGRILDADFARETANLTRTQILQQAGSAMLAQSNQLPAQVLSLLQ